MYYIHYEYKKDTNRKKESFEHAARAGCVQELQYAHPEARP